MDILDYDTKYADMGNIEVFINNLLDLVNNNTATLMSDADFIKGQESECLKQTFKAMLTTCIMDEDILNDVYNLALNNNEYEVDIIKDHYKDAITLVNKNNIIQSETDFKNVISYLIYKLAYHLVIQYEKDNLQSTLSYANVFYYLRNQVLVDQDNLKQLIEAYNHCLELNKQ